LVGKTDVMRYGIDFAETYRQVDVYTGSMLSAKPADLPVVQSTKFEFLINLKIAKALGLKVRRRRSPAPTR
jgi:putative tryptophan/tyrosine transport system substrate-binding protein